MARIRESHFRRDAFGIKRVYHDGRTETVTRPGNDKPLRLGSFSEATREANRMTTVQRLTGTWAISYRPCVLALDKLEARPAIIAEGTGF